MKMFGIKIHIHPLFLAVMALAVYGGFAVDLSLWFLVVILHEIGHIVAARRYGYVVEGVELLPFGGVARMAASTLGFQVRHETVIALCGPLVNLILALVTAMLHITGLVGDRVAADFLMINGMIALFNLLPALPLDGGRIARAGLAMSLGYKHATRVVTAMSFFLSMALMLIGALALVLGYTDAGLLALGAFLLFSAYTLSRQAKYDTLRFLDAKRLENSRIQPVRTVAVLPTASIGEIAGSFAPGHYHLIYITEKQTMLEEQAVLRAIFDGGMWREPISSLLST